MLGIVAILIIVGRVTSDESLEGQLPAFGIIPSASDLRPQTSALGLRLPFIPPENRLVFRKKKPYLYDKQSFNYRIRNPEFIETPKPEVRNLRSKV